MLAMLITVYLPGVGHMYLRQFKKGFLILGALLMQLFALSIRVTRDSQLWEQVQVIASGGRLSLQNSDELRSLVQTHMSQGEIFTWQLMYACVLAYAFTDIIVMIKRSYAQQQPPQQNENE